MNKLFYILLYISPIFSFAQDVKEDLINASCIRFSGTIYVFGYDAKSKDLAFKVVSYSEELKRIKDTSIVIGVVEPEKFHPITVDTLHGYLTFVLQRIDNEKTAQLIRFTKNMKLVTNIKDVEVSRINTFAAFDDEKLFSGNDLYIIRPASKDSLNKLYLQKFHVKDPKTLYEYERDWQFNFDKNKYKRCHVIMATKTCVYVYANVLSGTKVGQWILMIDAKSGELIHAEQLNEGMNDQVFLYSNYAYNEETKELVICGAKIPKSLADLESGRFDLTVTKLKTINTFVCLLDEKGVAKERKDNFIVIPAELAKEKEFKHFLFRTRKVNYSNSNYSILTEIVAEANPKLFKTYGFVVTYLTHDESGVLKAESSLLNPTLKDKKIAYAKYISDNYDLVKPIDTDWLYYKTATATSFLDFIMSSLTEKTVKGISSFENKTNGKLFYFQHVYKDKKWENKDFITSKNELSPQFIPLSINKHVIFFNHSSEGSNTKTDAAILSLEEW